MCSSRVSFVSCVKAILQFLLDGSEFELAAIALKVSQYSLHFAQPLAEPSALPVSVLLVVDVGRQVVQLAQLLVSVLGKGVT